MYYIIEYYYPVTQNTDINQLTTEESEEMIISNLEVQNQCKFTYATSGILQTDASGVVSAVPGNSSSGTWTPAFTNQTGITSITSDSAFYIRQGNIVDFAMSLAVTTSLLSPTVDISLPVNPSSNFTGSNQIAASCNAVSSSFLTVGSNPVLRSVSGALTMRLTFPGLTVGSWIVRVNGSYSAA